MAMPSPSFLEGLEVYVANVGIPHRASKFRVWQRAVPGAGGRLTTDPQRATHIVVGSSLPPELVRLDGTHMVQGHAGAAPPPPAAGEAWRVGSVRGGDGGGGGRVPAAETAARVGEGLLGGAGGGEGGRDPAPSLAQRRVVVLHSWLEACLSTRSRVGESEHRPLGLVGGADSGTTAAAGRALPPPPPALQVAMPGSKVDASDLQQALLWLLNGAAPAAWLKVNPAHVRRVVLLLVSGISVDVYTRHKEALAWLHTQGSTAVYTTGGAVTHPGQTVLALFSVPSSAKRKAPAGVDDAAAAIVRHLPESSLAAATQQAQPPLAAAAAAAADGCQQGEGACLNPQLLCATWEQMRAHDYPLPIPSLSGGWAAPEGYMLNLAPPPPTEPPGQRHDCGLAPGADPGVSGAGCSDDSGCATLDLNPKPPHAPEPPTVLLPPQQQQRMAAVDCEMCYTAEGLELTRVSLVGEQGQVLLDELVLPDRPITDYNTAHSGLDAATMSAVTLRLPDARAALLRHVGPATLLVGHSLENDLHALKLVHGRCVDTCMLFPMPETPPARASLRRLARQHLPGMAGFQAGSHDSVQDARAALCLVLAKMRAGGPWPAVRKSRADALHELLAASGRNCLLIDETDMLAHLAATATATAATAPLAPAPPPPLVAAAAAATTSVGRPPPAATRRATARAPRVQERVSRGDDDAVGMLIAALSGGNIISSGGGGEGGDQAQTPAAPPPDFVYVHLRGVNRVLEDRAYGGRLPTPANAAMSSMCAAPATTTTAPDANGASAASPLAVPAAEPAAAAAEPSATAAAAVAAATVVPSAEASASSARTMRGDEADSSSLWRGSGGGGGGVWQGGTASRGRVGNNNGGGNAAGGGASGSVESAPNDGGGAEAELEAALRRVDGLLRRVARSVPSGTLLVVTGGQGDTATARGLAAERLQLQYRVGREALRRSWPEAKQQALINARRAASAAPLACVLVV